MHKTSLARRLLASAVGLSTGVIGAVALVAPVQAARAEYTAVVDIADTCDGTEVAISAGGTSRNWRVLADGETVWGTFDDPPVAHSPDSDSGWLTGDAEATYLVEAEDAKAVTVQWWRDSTKSWATDEVDTEYPGLGPEPHDWTKPEECEDGADKPKASYELLPLVGCDLLVFAIRNDSGKDGDSDAGVEITMSLTPDHDTRHGHAPGYLPLLDAEADDDGFFEEPEDGGLEDPQEIGAGETVGPLGPFGPGESHAHGFIAVDGLMVTVEIAKIVDGKAIVVETADVKWDPKGLKCDEDGKGGEKKDDEKDDDKLPVTGVSTGTLALGALGLLAAGGALFLLARRRRITFTS